MQTLRTCQNISRNDDYIVPGTCSRFVYVHEWGPGGAGIWVAGVVILTERFASILPLIILGGFAG